jgi:periplasmic nitrate reductase NapD
LSEILPPSRRDIIAARLVTVQQETHISSLIVHSFPEQAEAVQSALRAMDGVEIHAESGGKIVITLETESEAEIVTRLDAISHLEGVLAATLVFHHFESDPAGPQG